MDHTGSVSFSNLGLGFLRLILLLLFRVFLSFLLLLLLIDGLSFDFYLVFSEVDGIVKVEISRARKPVIDFILLRLLLKFIQQTENRSKTIVMEQ